MIDDVVQAVVGVLTAAGLRAVDGPLAPSVQLPAVAVHGLPGRPQATSMTGRRDRQTSDVVLILVGTSPRSVRWLSDRIETALLDHRLVVAGRRCAPADRITASAPDVENDLAAAAWSSSQTYRIVSVRATAGAAP